MNPSVLSYSGHIQQKVYGTVSQDQSKLVTIGADQIINIWNINDMTSRTTVELANPNLQTFTCIQYNQKQNKFVIGTQSGTVYIVQQYNTANSEIIYKGQYQINSLKYSYDCEYLAIGSAQPRAILYSHSSNKFYRCDTIHQQQICYAAITNNKKMMITTGRDGFANIYRIQLQQFPPLPQLYRYRMSHKQQIKGLTMFWQRPSVQSSTAVQLSFSGSSTLQQLFMNSQTMECSYQLCVQIHQQSQIFTVCWINQYIIAIAVQNKISLWNYITKSKFQSLNMLNLRPILTDGNGRILGISANLTSQSVNNSIGLIYKYQNMKVIQKQRQQAAMHIKRMQEKNNRFMQNYDQPQQAQQQKIQQPKVQIKRLRKTETDYASKFIVRMPQTSLQSSYQSHMDAKFLFYNPYGCVIKRDIGQQSTIQLQYHDKFKIRRIKFEATNKYYFIFALTQNCFIYSTMTHLYFQMEFNQKNKRKDGTVFKQSKLIKWDYKIDVQGLAVGGQWVAVVNRQSICIFNFMGNQMHNICLDRHFIAVAAYQDILAVAYSASVPLGYSQFFEVKLYKIQSKIWKLEKKIKMPLKFNSQLKWFGFSQQGCLFNHDTSETVRMYLWSTNQWISVYQTDSNQNKIFIQHIQNYEIYGFNIEQVEGQPTQPTVMPRSLPRKIFFEIPHRSLSFFNAEQNKKLLQIYLYKLSLTHEKFRSLRWYKYKYSRRQDNIMYKFSQKIKTEQEIHEMMAQSDINSIKKLKQILLSLQNQLSGNQLEQAKLQLHCLCSSLLFTQQAISKVNQIFQNKKYIQQYQRMHQYSYQHKPIKYKNLSRLQAMIDVGWIQRSQD